MNNEVNAANETSVEEEGGGCFVWIAGDIDRVAVPALISPH